MSSSAPRQQLDPPAAAPFPYADARLPRDPVVDPEDEPEAAEQLARRQQEQTFERGRQAAQQELRAELDAALAANRDHIGRALQHFAEERQAYYRRVEGEVVQLALAIARKILHREVQIDPQALAGIVRVTLEKLDAGTGVQLFVHPREAADWRHYFACQPEGVPAPDVHDDPALPAGQCRIETSIGSTEVGLESQLREIETGLLDLLAERPGPDLPATAAPGAHTIAP